MPMEFDFPLCICLPLQQTQEWLDSLYKFIDSHWKLCDAHTVDFFSNQHWEHIVKDEWKPQLELLQDLSTLGFPKAGGNKGRYMRG